MCGHAILKNEIERLTKINNSIIKNSNNINNLAMPDNSSYFNNKGVSTICLLYSIFFVFQGLDN